MQVYTKDLMFHFPNQLCILFCLKTEVTFDFRFQFVMNFKLKHTNKKNTSHSDDRDDFINFLSWLCPKH